MDICKPNVDCNSDGMKNTYIEDFECSGNKPHKFTDSRLSFPSGHSSLSFYCMMYLAVSQFFKFKFIIILSTLHEYFIRYICKLGLKRQDMEW